MSAAPAKVGICVPPRLRAEVAAMARANGLSVSRVFVLGYELSRQKILRQLAAGSPIYFEKPGEKGARVSVDTGECGPEIEAEARRLGVSKNALLRWAWYNARARIRATQSSSDPKAKP